MNHELTLLLVEVFDDDESAQESVFVVNKPVIHFFLPLPKRPFKQLLGDLFKVSMLSFLFGFFFFFQ